MRTALLLLRTFVVFFTLVVPCVVIAQSRTAELKDFFRFEDLRDPQLSPDGKSVAYTLGRQLDTGNHLDPYPYLHVPGYGRIRGDIWVASTTGDEAERITDGSTDGAWFWEPMWSPNSDKLMMLSTRGGAIRIWVWSKGPRQLRLVSSREAASASLTITGHSEREWLSDDRIVFASPVNENYGLPPLASGDTATSHPSASVLESGKSPRDLSSNADIVLSDLAEGRDTIIATTNALNGPSWPSMIVSPDRRRVALLQRTAAKLLLPDRSMDVAGDNEYGLHWLYEVDVVDPHTPGKAIKLAGSDGLSLVYERSNVSWSPDSSKISLRSYDGELKDESTSTVRVCDVLSASCRAIAGLHLLTGSSRLMWHADHQLLARGWISGSNDKNQSTRWWRVGDDGSLVPFGASDRVPEVMYALEDHSGLIGLFNGVVWQIGNDGALLRPLSHLSSGTITALIRSNRFSGGSKYRYNDLVSKRIVVQIGNGPAAKLAYLDLSTSEMMSLEVPASHASLLDYEGSPSIALFIDSSDATTLWATGQDRSRTEITSVNDFVKEIIPFRTETFNYRTADGEEVSANLLLPTDYSPGHRYPLVVSVYPGSGRPKIEGGTVESLSQIRAAGGGNLQLWAAHGYVVLQPSMPHFTTDAQHSYSSRAGNTREPYFNLGKGVFPAIDKAIEMGIADPERIGLTGGSFGGYAALGLITQTSRFKAAIAASSFCDLLSFSGPFYAPDRYKKVQEDSMFGQTTYLEGTLQLKSPYWMNEEVLLRNSPLTYVDRVKSPVMLVHGDEDFVPIQQAEEFFNALTRQDKRAEFVRYWGQGHINGFSQATLFDLWQRQYAWFDEYVKGAGKSKGAE